MIQTREGAGLSHFYASILSGFRAPQAAGWRSLSRASEQVDHLLESLKPRLLIFDEFHSALRGRRQCRVALNEALPQSVWRTILRTGRFRRDSDDFKEALVARERCFRSKR